MVTLKAVVQMWVQPNPMVKVSVQKCVVLNDHQ